MIAYDMNIRNGNKFFQQIHFGVNTQYIEESRHNRNFNSIYRNNRIEKVQIVGINTDFNRVTDNHNIRTGTDIQLNSLSSKAYRTNILNNDVSKLDTRYPDGENTMNSFAAYFSHTWKINQEVVLNDGFRIGYTTLSSAFIDTTFFPLPYQQVQQQTPVYSGSIGIINLPNNEWKFSALLSSGFRVPNVDDLSKVFESYKGRVIVPNNNIKPEKTINSEIGITHYSGAKSHWNNTIYYTQFYDAIVTDKFKFNGNDSIMYDGILSEVYANQNKQRAYIYGISSGYNRKFSEIVEFNISANYTYGRIKTDSADTPLDHIPPFMAKIQLVYNHKKLSSQFFMVYNGWKKLKDYNTGGEDNLQYATPEGMPAWITANIRFSYKVNKYLTLQTGIDNIFDTQYRAFASGINAPGRNIFGTIRFNY
jgi:hemoglobin/transferrin/lactoferrin receptor protein